MKKIISILLCLTILIIITGCGNKKIDLDVTPMNTEQKELLLERVLNGQMNKGDSRIKILSHQLTINNSYGHIIGDVKNVYDSTISYYKITCKFLDSDGNIIDSTFTNSGQNIGSAEIRKFDIKHKWDDRFKDYKLIIEDVSVAK